MKRRFGGVQVAVLIAVALVLLLPVVLTTAARLFIAVSLPATLDEISRASAETTSVPIGTAQALDTTIRMGVGMLQVHAAQESTAALRASFEHMRKDWLPEVHHSADATRGVVVVEEVDGPKGVIYGEVVSQWDLALARGVPTSVTIEAGTGDVSANLREVDVRQLNATSGFGEMLIDLSGPRKTDVTGCVRCRVGGLKLVVPTDVGVRLRGWDAGICTLDAQGFSRSGDDMVNSAWGSAGPKIDLNLDLDLERGGGKLTLANPE